MPSKTVSWREIGLAPIVLLKGKEELFAQRALSRLRNLARQVNPQVEISFLSPVGYQKGDLAVLTSPSLFAEPRLVIVENLESLTDDLRDDLLFYTDHPEEDVWLVAQHTGGVKGKKLLDRWKKLGVPTVDCEPIKQERAKLELVVADVKAEGLKIEPAAAQLLVDALGSDLSQLAAATNQLCSDFLSQVVAGKQNPAGVPAQLSSGTITYQMVETYWGNRVEASAFKVCDATVAGQTGVALKLLRQAYQGGLDPVLIAATLALRIRQLAWVSGGVKPGDGLNLPPWQAQRLQKEVRGWSEAGLAIAIAAVAAADHEVKGASRDPYFAVERAVRRISQARYI